MIEPCGNCGKPVDTDKPPYYMLWADGGTQYYCNEQCCQEATKPKCENCKYYFPENTMLWQPNGKPSIPLCQGRCKRHAPVAIDGKFNWPILLHDMWCGDNKPRKNVSDPIIRRNAENKPEMNSK